MSTNSIFEAMSEVSEDYAAEALAPRRRKMKTPLKIVIIIAAALALGTSAVAATSGEHPTMKLNFKQMASDYDEYVTADGWTVKTLSALEPYDEIAAYRPVGKIRASYSIDNDDLMLDGISTDGNDGSFIFYDELGVNVINIARDTNLFAAAFKDEKSDMSTAGAYRPDYIRGGARIAADYSSVNYEEWVDPILYVQYLTQSARDSRMSPSEKAELLNIEGFYSEFDDYGGIRHPSAEEHIGLDGYVSIGSTITTDDEQHNKELWRNAYTYRGIPSEICKLFGFSPLIGTDMTEEEGRCYALLSFDVNKREFTQGLYQYSLTDAVSGTTIEFTAWHFADLRESFTEHFGFDYEYIMLNNDTQAKIHRSVTGDYIAEFEHNGAAYAFKTSLERGDVSRIFQNLGLLNE